MAPNKYKLTYFNYRALGEPIRYLLSYGGVDFEDFRVKDEDWPKFKPTTPFGKMPLLDIDGKQAHQSVAICRYLAKQFGLVGSNDWEALQIDAVVDTVVDIRQAMAGLASETNEEAKAKKKEIVVNETLPFYLPKLDNLVKANEGYFVGGKLTWADLYFVASHDFLGDVVQQNLTANYPNLKSLVERVNALPAIKSWIEKRPVTIF